MPPRKSDAASRKSNAGAEAAAAATAPTEPAAPEQARPSTADASQADDSQLAEAAEAEAAEAADTTATTATATAAESTGPPGKTKSHHGDAVTIEDLNMPRSIVTRLTKGVLPPTTQLQGSAITAMTKSATVFISHLANAANTLTTNAGKKTIMPADVFAALDDIEFGFMKEQLEAEFAKFNQIQTSKRTDYRKRAAAAKKGPDGQDEAGEEEAGADKDGAAAAAAEPAPVPRDAPPQAKKAKRAHGGKVADSAAADEEEAELEEHEEQEEQEEHEEHELEDEEDEEDEEEEDEEEDDEEDGADREEAEEEADDAEEDEALDSDGSE